MQLSTVIDFKLAIEKTREIMKQMAEGFKSLGFDLEASRLGDAVAPLMMTRMVYLKY